MNDLRVTNYALGELSGAEREAFEKELAASAELQNELKEAVALAEALQGLPMEEGFTAEERAALREECAVNLKVVRRRFVFRRIAVVGSIAASVMLAVGVLIFFSSQEQKTTFVTTEVAMAPKPEPVAAATPMRLTIAGDPGQALAQEEQVRQNIRILTAENEALKGRLLKQTEILSTPEQEAREAKRSMVLSSKHEGGDIAVTGNAQTTVSPQMIVAASPALGSSQPADGSQLNVEARTAALAPAPQPFQREIQQDAMMKPSAPLVTMAPASVTQGGLSKDGGAKVAAWSSQARAFKADREFNTEAYDAVQENVFLTARENPLSTFSIDVDTASYANVRRFLQNDQLPPSGAIRTEELINYFTYDYAKPEGDSPFSVNLEVSRAPWDAKRELVRIGLKGRELPESERGPANLVFLIDVSGSMNEPDKLPLLRKSLRGLVENLAPEDRVAIVVYAGSSGLVLPSTEGAQKQRILEALDNLQAGGSTNGAEGIRLAYQTAREYFLKGGNNRVILCTDGDFNVGTTSQSELVKLIEKERASGVFLSVLGFGTGNLKDSTMEKLADKGNGNYAYIDSLTEGRKVLVEQMGATLFTIAKDVKIQVEFNPARVAGYRLIGYENRLLAKEDFNDDKKDAGEIGAGHAVTALYEIIPAGEELPDHPGVDPLKYQPTPASGGRLAELLPEFQNLKAEEERLKNSGVGDGHPTMKSLRAKKEVVQQMIRDEVIIMRKAQGGQTVDPTSNELLTVKLRYKAPDGDKSRLLEVPLAVGGIPAFDQASRDFQFAAAVAAFGMKLRGSPAAGDLGWPDIQSIVRRTLGDDPGSYRAEFLTLIEKAARLNAAKKE